MNKPKQPEVLDNDTEMLIQLANRIQKQEARVNTIYEERQG